MQRFLNDMLQNGVFTSSETWNLLQDWEPDSAGLWIKNKLTELGRCPSQDRKIEIWTDKELDR